ncbi:RNA polymerase sigma-70 factor, ECF subfamily [Mucilaginibacter sp. OK268]|uniref:RNA polymerase sigma factor n=1 Tax=Mucilaginibacter sp. OK268 TaxID=1881048 RepID=UPI00088DEA86|nr:sigma-70 family RNA polymerase sigma factor [Mucilaginibacter sp. OK268]SDP86127.1 RNA polymerase sigma-70 factor, ECF subfamily [Mucilaginibacter sp. OK268]
MSTVHLNDNDLVVALRNDDVKAFEQLYLKYRTAIYKNILKLLKDPDESRNVMQDVFVSLWEKRMTLDPLKQVSGWLFGVSYNKSITRIKKMLKESSMFKHIENDLFCGDEQYAYLKEAKLKLLDEAFLNLSPQKQRVFELCKLQGKTCEETAIELKISKYTVKEYLAAAVKNIKEYIERHPIDHLLYIFLTLVLLG